MNDIDNVVETLKIEMERTKINLFKGDDAPNASSSALMLNIDKATKHEIVTCEDKMISLL